MTDELDISTADLSAENTFCSTIALRGDFNVSISGIWVGTITVQRSFDDGVSWKDVEPLVANAEKIGNEHELGVIYRMGFKTGEYGSGAASVRISQWSY